METPLYTHLTEYHKKNRISFAMPGHKNGRGLFKGLIDCDVTELAATEDLHDPGEFISRSQKLIAKKYGAKKSYILTGGSTAGIQAMIAAALNPGDILLSSPDCHMSVINTCALLGIRLMLCSAFKSNNGYWDFDGDELKMILESNPDIKAFIAVSPDYYGMSKDVKGLTKICHEHNIPILIDQAHGAHFIASDKFPEPACAIKADCTVMSAHKSLNALTGAAYLHINSELIDTDRLQKALSMFQSSSPSYVIAASAETAALALDNNAWEETVNLCNDLKSRSPLTYLKNDDPTRLVFFTGKISGFEAEKILADKFGIDIEMADLYSIVLIATPSNTKSDFDSLYNALCTFKTDAADRIIPNYFLNGIFSPSEGFFCESEAVPIEESEGRVSAATVAAYPPGAPIICCGAVINSDMIREILKLRSAGAKIIGSDGYIRVKK